ncbi:anti-sigma factor [Rapidithrix thailandica]|uniref:Anti-sigma factor n=1 Tax=Rapidithrix thailandica TaxID=413964 RepID=A0AAW9S337_9BACT
MKKLWILGMLLTTALLYTACDDDDDNGPVDKNLQLSVNGLTDLGSGYAYEGWLIVNGTPKSTGVFTVDGSGMLSKSGFKIPVSDLSNASAFVLTIEPSPDSDPAPSEAHILAGDFSNGSANLSVAHTAALGDDFGDAAGKYILATPTNGPDSDENSGVWFLDPALGPGATLNLPTLPAGWTYEGWAVIGGSPVTTGTFTQVDMADDAAPFSGDQDGPPFPGEDFLVNAPTGLTFPTDLSGTTIVISIEPVPDNSSAPFLLKPLLGNVPADADSHTTYEMMQNLNSFPTGSVTSN